MHIQAGYICIVSIIYPRTDDDILGKHMLAMPLILHFYCARFIVSGIDVVIIPVMKTPAAQTGVRIEYIYK